MKLTGDFFDNMAKAEKFSRKYDELFNDYDSITPLAEAHLTTFYAMAKKLKGHIEDKSFNIEGHSGEDHKSSIIFVINDLLETSLSSGINTSIYLLLKFVPEEYLLAYAKQLVNKKLKESELDDKTLKEIIKNAKRASNEST